MYPEGTLLVPRNFLARACPEYEPQIAPTRIRAGPICPASNPIERLSLLNNRSPKTNNPAKKTQKTASGTELNTDLAGCTPIKAPIIERIPNRAIAPKAVHITVRDIDLTYAP